MSWGDHIADAFPPRRDDEPANLRRDIADELADHLDRALRREQFRTADTHAARQNVLNRFGDPKWLARKLWFDAMKEKIMAQRIMLVVMILLVVTCIVGLAFAWMSFQQMQQVNQAMMEKLDTITSRSDQPQVVTDWVTARFRLVEGTKDGKPVVGQRVRLRGRPFNAAEREELRPETDSDGVVTFAPIRPGQYSAFVDTASGLHRTWKVILYPGRNYREEVVCPAGSTASPRKARITFAVNWPQDLRNKDIVATCEFERIASTPDRVWWSGGTTWATVGQGGNVLLKRGSYGKRWKDRNLTWKRELGWNSGSHRLRYIEIYSLDRSNQEKQTEKTPKAYSCSAQHAYIPESGPVFEASPVGVNHWKITPPEDVLKQVREGLAKLEKQPSTRPGRR